MLAARTMLMQRTPNPYHVLNVSSDAEPEVIEAAYKVLMKKYHPDRMAGSEGRAAELNAAFNILRDPQRRARHDADEKAHRLGTSASNGRFDGNRQGPQPGSHFQRAVVVTRPPLRRPPQPNHRGRIVAGWVFAMAALAATAVALMVAQQPGGATAKVIGAGVRAAAEQVQEAAGSGQLVASARPVSRRDVGDALERFERVQALYGPVGVAAYSDACFDAQSRSRDLDDFDFCIAFDHAAMAYAGGAGESAAAPLGFTDAQWSSRHASAARLIADDREALERMSEIMSLTHSTIADRAMAATASSAPAPKLDRDPDPARQEPQAR
jgi:curved DNA-binding protein CbpA